MIFLKNSRQLTVQDKQGTHEQISLKKTQLWIIQVTTQYEELSIYKLLNGVVFIKSTIIFSCGLHVNIFYVKYLIQISTK